MPVGAQIFACRQLSSSQAVSHYAAWCISSRARLLSFSQELYRDFTILIGQFLNEEF